MKVKIIIPTYDRLESLKRTIRTIVAGDYADIHIVVVIDGNREMNFPFSASFITVLHNETRQDWIFSMNRALKVTKDTDAVIYASDDLEFPQDAISKAVAAMRTYFPDRDGVIGLKQTGGGIDSAFGLIGSKFIERFPDRKVFCPDYMHYVSDVELGNYARSLNKFHLCNDVILKHHRQEDETRKIGLRFLSTDLMTETERLKKGFLWGNNFGRVTE